MIKIFCDRCQKEITKDTRPFLDLLGDTIKTAVEFLNGAPNYKIYDGDDPVTFCPDCRESFKEWMKAGRISQHPEEDTKVGTSDKWNGITNPAPLTNETPNPEEIKFGGF